MDINELESIRKELMRGIDMVKSPGTVGYLIHTTNRLFDFITEAKREQEDIERLASSALSKLRDAKLFPDETVVDEIPTKRGVYVSFVGDFEESDHSFAPRCDDGLDMDDYNDYQDYVLEVHRAGLDNVLREREIISEKSNGSLTVTYYSDSEPGWMVVVADCHAGGWLESARVNIDSFVGGAAVPSGCECVPNQ